MKDPKEVERQARRFSAPQPPDRLSQYLRLNLWVASLQT